MIIQDQDGRQDIGLVELGNNMRTTKKILLEKSYLSSSIRNIVRDVIMIFKKNDDGQFNLPEELGDQDLEYKLPKSSISVELIITPSDIVEDFLLNGNFYKKEDVIVLKIVYNPKNKKQILYNLIGELNEVIAHELRHQYQRDNAMFGMDQGIDDDDDDDEDEVFEEEKTGFEYYSKPEEIDAQVDGFKRMKYVTRRPFEELVRNWFTTHREIHQMNLDEEKKIIDMIIDYYRNS